MDFVTSCPAFAKAGGKDEPASVFAVLTYDAVDSMDLQAIYDSLDSLLAFNNVTGNSSFDDLHDAVKPALMFELKISVVVFAMSVNP